MSKFYPVMVQRGAMVKQLQQLSYGAEGHMLEFQLGSTGNRKTTEVY